MTITMVFDSHIVFVCVFQCENRMHEGIFPSVLWVMVNMARTGITEKRPINSLIYQHESVG